MPPEYELKEISQIRKRLGLSQSELARLAGISQSLIAKIEAGKLDPSYTNAKRIFSALDSIQQKKEIKVEKVMNKKIISVSPNNTISSAVQKMRKHEISQMPVLEGGTIVGLVSETVLLDALVNENKKNEANCVGDVMDDAPPVVAIGTSLSIVSSLLRHFPVVLVASKGKLVGVAAKSDILKVMVS